MNRKLGLLFILGLTACARSGPAPVAPVAARPAPDESPPAPVAVAPSATISSTRTDTVAPPAANLTPSVRPAAVQTVTDTAAERAFLDTLHAAAPDTTSRRSAAVEQTAPEEVRNEAVAMFGRDPNAPVTWDLDVTPYTGHGRVLFWMDYFTGRSRWHFERYIERAGRYDSMIRTRLAAAGLPQDLLYLAMIESGFAQNIRSHAGAVGVWQFMPATARRYGLTVDAWVDERRDPFLATDAAIRFLSELNNKFGSWYLAAAAYNSGPGRISRGLARGDYGALNGNDAYFAMAETSVLRRETRDYVPKLIAAALLAKQPERYGFTDLERWVPLVYDSVQVPWAVGLDVVARLSGASREEIEELNPRYLRGVTPPDRASWVKVPLGSGAVTSVRLAALPSGERVTFVVHFVARGETLSHLATRYKVSVADIKSANRLSSNRLGRGQRLVIPTSSSRVRSQTPPVPNEGVRATRRMTSRSTPAAAAGRPATSPRGTPVRARSHTVARGDNMFSISQRYGVTLDALLAANNMTRRSVIKPGQTIRIPR